MRRLLLSVALAVQPAVPAPPARVGVPGHPAYCPHPPRSTGAVRRFLAPFGYARVPKDSVVDHDIPLCICGRDAPENMHLQGRAAAAAKDAFEKRLCAALAKQYPPAPAPGPAGA